MIIYKNKKLIIPVGIGANTSTEYITIIQELQDRIAELEAQQNNIN